jgi:hypothetical protein
VSPDGAGSPTPNASTETGSSDRRARGGEPRRLTNADCNTISPAWRVDSKTLIYASDCGRGFALTALGTLSAVP